MKLLVLALALTACGGSQVPQIFHDDWCLSPQAGTEDLPDGWQDSVRAGSDVWHEAGLPQIDLRDSCPWPLTVEDLGPGVLGRARASFLFGTRISGWVKFDDLARWMRTSVADCGGEEHRLLTNLASHELGHFAGVSFPDNSDDTAHNDRGVMSRYIHPLCDVIEPRPEEIDRMKRAVKSWKGYDNPSLTITIDTTLYDDGTCEHEVEQ